MVIDDPQAVLSDLARAKVTFQLRSIAAVIGADHIHVRADGTAEPVECGCIPGHRVSLVTQACVRCDLTEQEFADHGNRPCARGLWPRAIVVPLPSMRGRQRDAPEGTEEGELCFRGAGCQGRLVLRSRDGVGCYCGAVHAPCPSCMSRVPECPVCYHREEEPS